MSWLGKVIGGTIGLALGGPLGAVAGAAFGHAFVDRKEDEYLRSIPGNKRPRITSYNVCYTKLLRLNVTASL